MLMRKSRSNRQFDKIFGEYVRKTREARGWSQTELAGRMDNNFQNISRIERGEITPTIFWCYKLAHVFEMDVLRMIEEVGFQIK